MCMNFIFIDRLSSGNIFRLITVLMNVIRLLLLRILFSWPINYFFYVEIFWLESIMEILYNLWEF